MQTLKKTAWGSVALALVVWLLDLPLLAIAPQSGDAAEQLLRAQLGGILHPPGFPFQAWLNRAFVHIPFAFSTTGLALLSSVGHALACYFIAETLRLLGARSWARVVGVAAFAFFPSVWFNSVRPEVFALSNFFFALMLYQMTAWRINPPENCRWTAALGLGVTVGLAGAQHSLNVLALPLFLISAWTLATPRSTRALTLVWGAGSFLFVFFSLYASLPALSAGNHLDWAPLKSAGEILNHALRKEYGIFTLGSGSEEMTANGLRVFAEDALVAWTLFLGLVFLGGSVLWKLSSTNRPLFYGPVAVLVLEGCVLLRSVTFGKEGIAEGIVNRLQGPAVVVCAVLMGLGFSQLQQEMAARPGRRNVFAVAALAFFFGSVAHYWNYVNAGAVATVELFRVAIVETLPVDAVYVSASDTEALYGVPTKDGIRFPIESGSMSRKSYTQSLSLIDPRFEAVGSLSSIAPLIESAYEKGWNIASTEVRLLWAGDRKPELRGLLFILNKKTDSFFGQNTVDAALRLCPFLEQLRVLPVIADPMERNFYAHFARAYHGAAQFLADTGKKESADQAETISKSLKEGRQWLVWTGACRRLTEVLRPKVQPQK
jgi:hypothetical protein